MKVMVQTALRFLDRPYQSGTLDISARERLIWNTDAFDCLTYIETCLALVRSEHNRTNPRQELSYIRYRKGKKKGYASRLHYALDWIADNESKGVLKNITADLGGQTCTKPINFMSSHINKYPRLTRTALLIIKRIEKKLSQHSFVMIPTEHISRSLAIQNGDLIFFTTSKMGLGAFHVGIAYWQNHHLTFIHASSRHRRVLINAGDLHTYCHSIPSLNGIIVCRPLLGRA